MDGWPTIQERGITSPELYAFWMAGFAIVVAALSYGVLGLTVAAIGSICLYLSAKKRVKRRASLVCASTQFAALLWLLVLVHLSKPFALCAKP
jgi:hypothetical protein